MLYCSRGISVISGLLSVHPVCHIWDFSSLLSTSFLTCNTPSLIDDKNPNMENSVKVYHRNSMYILSNPSKHTITAIHPRRPFLPVSQQDTLVHSHTHPDTTPLR
jgi:hypothetical protein